MKSERYYIKIEDAFKHFGQKLPNHISCNPNLNNRNGAQYQIIRESTHDGTGIFTKELIGDVIRNLANKTSYAIGQNLQNVVKVEYEVSNISVACVYGNFDINGIKMQGQRERMRISVICKLTYKD